MIGVGVWTMASGSPAWAGDLEIEQYNTTEHTIPLGELSPRQWLKTIEHYRAEGGWRIDWRNPETGALSPLEPREQDRAMNAAISMGVEHFSADRTAIEYDLVVADAQEKDGPKKKGRTPLRPVTIWTLGRKHLAVSVGPPLPAPPSGPSAAQVVKTHALAGSREEGARFTPRLTGVIEVALSRLSPREHAAIRDIVLVRKGGASPDTRGKWVNDAVYEVDDDRGAILLYDEILQPTRRFVGPVTEPHHPATMTLLHELGHAVDDAPRRQLIRRFNAMVEAFNRDAAASNAMADRLNSTQASDADIAAFEKEQARLAEVQRTLDSMRKELEKMRAVSEGFRKRFGGITEYGATSDSEAFAEAFGLYHLDREALQRIAPDVVAWFEAEAHLKGVSTGG